MNVAIPIATVFLALAAGAPSDAARNREPTPAAETSHTACSPEISWTELRYEARKLLLTATATVQVETVPSPRVVAELRTSPEGGGRAPAGPCVTVLKLASDVPIGRDEVATAWLDSRDGGVLQVDKVATGRGAFRKVFRYSDTGFFMWRAAPASDGEKDADPDLWSKRKTATVTADRPGRELSLTDSYALLYLLSLVPRERADVSHRALMFADDTLTEVAFRVGGLSLRDVDYRETRGGGERRIEGRRLLRQISVTAAPVNAKHSADDVDLGFLGMKGKLVVWVDMETGVPVELDGRADTIGRLQVTLTRATLTP